MKRTGFRSSTLLLCLVLAGACSDDATLGDGSVDGALPDTARSDSAVDAGLDQAPLDAATLPDGPLGEKCRQASPIPLQAGFGKAFGQILVTDQSNDVDLSGSSCTKKATPGAERIHTVMLEAGKSYTITVAPEMYGPPGVELAAYVFTSCVDVAGSCLAGGAVTPIYYDSGAFPPYPPDGGIYPPEGGPYPYPDSGPIIPTDPYSVQLSVVPQQSGLHYVGVDSIKAVGVEGSYGSYTVSVTERPANDSCAGAVPMTWNGSKAAATGVLTAASDSVSFVSSPSCSLGPLQGPDLFYEVDLTGGKTYRLAVPSIGASLYVFTSCADVSGSCIAGTPMGQSLIVSPPKTGKYLVGVDMPYPPPPQIPLSFTLTVEEVTPPSNDSCASATPMSWSGSSASASGDLSLATDKLDLGASGCTGQPTPGPDLFYEVSLTGGKSYRVSISPPLPASLYVLTDCTNPAASCVAGVSFMKGPPLLTFTAKQGGKHIVGVDMEPYYSSGGLPTAITVKVEEFTPAPNDSCATPTVLSWVQGKASAAVSFANASDTLDLGGQSCIGYGATPGPDLFYEVALTSGKAYSATLTVSPTSPPPTLYVLSSCAASSCIAGSELKGLTPKTTFFAPASGNYIVGVDYGYTFYPGQPLPGPMTLEVEEFTPASNSSCANPQALSFSGTEVVVQGDTDKSINDITGIQCYGGTPYDGPQLYYTIPLTAQKEYLVLLEPDPSTYFNAGVYAFPASTACTATAINPACYYTSSGLTGMGAPFVHLKPQVTEDWVVVVDGYAGQSGSFTLKIQELTVPANDTCAGAELLAFPPGQTMLTIAGQTLKASNTVDLTAAGCTKQTTLGPDVFYKLPVKAGYTYQLMLAPMSQTVDFALYLFTSCANISGTCGPGMGVDQLPFGGPETLTYTAPSDQTIFIGVDGRNAGDLGIFALNVFAQSPPPANDTCATAEKLTFDTSGVATAQGDTTGATDSFPGCSPTYPLMQDVFYQVSLTANQTYTITVTPSASFDPAIYLMPTCMSCQTTVNNGGAGDKETLTYTPKTSGNVWIGVDTFMKSGGSFTIEVK